MEMLRTGSWDSTLKHHHRISTVSSSRFPGDGVAPIKRNTENVECITNYFIVSFLCIASPDYTIYIFRPTTIEREVRKMGLKELKQQTIKDDPINKCCCTPTDSWRAKNQIETVDHRRCLTDISHPFDTYLVKGRSNFYLFKVIRPLGYLSPTSPP